MDNRKYFNELFIFQSIIRYVRNHQLVNLCRVNENARQILRMVNILVLS